MNDYDAKFTTESVDERVEQLLSQSRQQGNATSPLAYIWSSLVKHIGSERRRRDVQDGASEQQQIANFANGHSAKNPAKQAGLSRFRLIAAVLMAALVVGNMVWIMTLTRRQGTSIVSSTQQNSSPSGIYIGAGNGVFRIDKQTHKLLWHYKLPAPPPGHCSVTGDCALFARDLVLVKNMLYVPLVSGELDVLDTNNGTLRWSRDFEMGLRQITVIDGKLYSIVSSVGSSYSDYYIYSLDPVTGREYQHYHFLHTSDYASFSVAGQTLYASFSNNLSALNLADGKRIWHQQIDQKLAFFGLQVVNGALYTSSIPKRENTAGSVNSSGGYVYAFNTRTGTKIWQSATMRNALFTMVAENVIYLSTDQYMLYAYDAKTSNALWHHAVGTYSSRLVVDAGVVYIAGTFGENTPYRGVIALNAKDGSVKWQTPDNSKSANFTDPASGPVIVDGTLYVGDLALHALNPKDGSALWTIEVSGLDVPPIIVTIVVAPY